MKQLYLCFFLCIFFIPAFSQDFDQDVPKENIMEMKRYDADTSASAVVVNEYGDGRIVTTDEGSRLRFEYHTRIKILGNKGVAQGNFIIPLHQEGDRVEQLESVKGTTYYHDDDGLVRLAQLDQKKVYRETRSKYTLLVKFTMPSVKPGSVIDVKYTTVSPFFFNFHRWQFQDEIPKMESRYLVHIPANYNYNVALRGPLKLSETKAELERECFGVGANKADCSRILYAMKNVPAFIEEDYMTAASNFISAMDFELSDYTPFTGGKVNVTKNWKDVDYELKTHSDFGVQMKRSDLFKQPVATVISGAATDLEKAKKIYTHVQKWFKWDNAYGMLSTDGLKKAWDRRSGNVGDINLSLIGALQAAGLNTEAVILSTRNNGFINKLYPVLSEFNYVVARVTVNGSSYLLDATDPLLPFGLLPVRCINDQGRVISLKNPSFWLDLQASQSEKSTINLDLNLQADGKIKGVLTQYSLGYEAYNKRKDIRKYNSTEEYVDALDEKWAKIKILKSNIDNIDSLENPLIERYEVEMPGFSSMAATQLFFNPYLFNRITENPFKQNERSYPVDFGASSDKKVIATLTFPDGFEIVSQPKSQALSLPNKGGRFISQIETMGNKVIISQLTQLNNAIYAPEEYPYLKELYNRIIQTQKTDLIFRKKTS